MNETASTTTERISLRRSLGLWDLILYGIIVIQPTAPMPVFGVIYTEARGHVVTAILLAMFAMLLTAISYGHMARLHPQAGSAFTYVGKEIHPGAGYLAGWCMAMDYILNPLICTIWCSKAAQNFVPDVPYIVWAVVFATMFTALNLNGVETSARVNAAMAAALGVVILMFVAAAIRFIARNGMYGNWHNFTLPFYDPATFSARTVLHGTSLAVLTYIGFDGITTLSEEAHNPQRNVPRAVVLTCLVTGVLAAIEVYLGQLVWRNSGAFSGGGYRICPCSRTRWRRRPLHSSERGATGGDHRFRNGRSTGRCPTPVRHGPRRSLADQVFRSHRTPKANPEK